MNSSNWAEALLKAMIQSDRVGAGAIIDDFIGMHGTPDEAIHNVLDPALIKLGVMWDTSTVSLAQTFVAAKIAEDVLLRCLPKEKSSHTHGIVVIGNIEDDYHSLGRRIVSSFLLAMGWEVRDLGNDVPAEKFIDEAEKSDAHIVAASAMMQTTAMNIKKIRVLIDQRKLHKTIKLAVGGAV